MSITLADILIAFRGDRNHVDRTQAGLERDLRGFAAQAGIQTISFRGDTSGVQQARQQAEGQAKGFAGTMRGILTGALSFVVGGVLTGGLNAVAGGIASIANGMVGGNAAFEDYNVRFTTLLKSTDLARQRMADLATFATNTPFELPQVVQADLILQGFGFHAADAAKKFKFSGDQIRTIAGDIASGTGRSFEEIASLLGRFSTGETGEALTRFGELGAVTRDQLAQMGVQFSKTGELVSDKVQAMTALLTILQGKYGGLMEAQSMTFGGMLSNLQDWFGNAARIVGQPVFEGLRTSLFMLLQVLNSPEVQAGIQALAQGMASLVTQIGAAIQAILPFAARVAGVMLPLIQLAWEWGSGFVNAFAEGISAAVGLVADALGGLASLVTGLLQPHSPPKILPNLDQWGTQAAQVWMDGWKEADFSLFQSIGKDINQALANAVGMGAIPEIDQIPILANVKAALAELIARRNQNGGAFFEDDLLKLQAAAGPAGQAVYDLADAYLKVDWATRQATAAQDTLNDTTARYDAILSPLNDQMRALDSQEQAIRDAKRLAEIKTKMATATGSDRELLQIEMKRISLRRQIDTQQQARDTAVQAAQAKVDAAKKEQQAQQAQLDTQKAALTQQQEGMRQAQAQTDLLAKLAKQAGTTGTAMGGLAKSQTEINAAVAEARAKAKALKDQYEALKTSVTTPFTQGQQAATAFIQAVGRVTGLSRLFQTLAMDLQRVREVFAQGVAQGGLVGGVSALLSALGRGNPLLAEVARRVPVLVQAFQVGAVNGFVGGLMNVLAALGDLNPAFGTLAAVAQRVGSMLGWANTTLVTFASTLLTEGIGAALGGLRDRIGVALPALVAGGQELAHGLVEALLGAIPEGIRSRISQVAGPVLGALTALFASFSLAPLFAGLAPMGTFLTPLLALFAPLGTALGWIGGLFSGLVPSIGGLSAAFGVLLGGLSTGMAALAPMVATFVELAGQGILSLHLIGGVLLGGLGSVFAGVGGMFANVGLALALLSQRIPALSALFLRIGPAISGGLGAFITKLGPSLIGLVTRLGPTLLSVGKTILGLTSPLGIAITLIGLFAGAWATNFGGIRKIVETTLGPVLPILSGLDTLFQLVLGQLLQGNWSGAFALLQQGFRELGPLLGGVATSFQQGIPQIFSVLMAYLGQIATTVIGWLSAMLPKVIVALGAMAAAFIAWILPMIPPMLASLGKLLGSLLDAIGQAIPGLLEALATVAGAFLLWVGPLIPPLLLELGKLLLGMLNWITERAPGVLAKLSEWGLQLIGWVAPQIPLLLLALGGLLAGLLAWIVAKAPDILDKLGEWSKQFTTWVTTDALPKLLSALGTMFTTLWTELQRLWGAAFAADGSLGASIITGLRTGIIDGWGAFSSWFVKKLTDAVPDFLKGPLGINDQPATPEPPHRAGGGGVQKGKRYIVGENGPEFFVAPADGEIEPNAVYRAVTDPRGAVVDTIAATAPQRATVSVAVGASVAAAAAPASARAPQAALSGLNVNLGGVTVAITNPVVDTDARLNQLRQVIKEDMSEWLVSAINRTLLAGI